MDIATTDMNALNQNHHFNDHMEHFHSSITEESHLNTTTGTPSWNIERRCKPNDIAVRREEDESLHSKALCLHEPSTSINVVKTVAKNTNAKDGQSTTTSTTSHSSSHIYEAVYTNSTTVKKETLSQSSENTVEIKPILTKSKLQLTARRRRASLLNSRKPRRSRRKSIYKDDEPVCKTLINGCVDEIPPSLYDNCFNSTFYLQTPN